MSLLESKFHLHLTAYCNMPGLEVQFFFIPKHILAVLRTPLLLSSSSSDIKCRPEGFGAAHTVKAHVGHAASFAAATLSTLHLPAQIQQLPARIIKDCQSTLARFRSTAIVSWAIDISRMKEKTLASVSLWKSSRSLVIHSLAAFSWCPKANVWQAASKWEIHSHTLERDLPIIDIRFRSLLKSKMARTV